MEDHLPFIGKMMSRVFNMEQTVGPDFEMSLADLKRAASLNNINMLSSVLDLVREGLRQLIEQQPPAVFAHPWAIRAFEERALMRAGQRCSISHECQGDGD